MGKPTEILGKDAPEHWWDELKLLREKVAALEADKKTLQEKADALAAMLLTSIEYADCAQNEGFVIQSEIDEMCDVLEKTGYHTPSELPEV